MHEITPPRNLAELFTGFLSIGARSFGGVMPWAYRVMVEERRWISAADFAETVGLCQFLPGPNIGNTSVVLGKRWFGWRGSIVGFLGLVAVPFVWVLALAAFYGDYASIPLVRAVVIGVGAAGAGLFIGTAVKLGRPLAKKPAAWVVVMGSFLAVAVGRVSLLLVVPVAFAIAIALSKWGKLQMLLELALYFGLLSLISVGGMPSVIPEMQRYVVEVKQWISAADFIQMFAVGQAAPGPNVLISGLIGWKVAGLSGACVALAAMCLPAGVVAFWVAGLWERMKDSPWRKVAQRAMAPMVVGLVLSGGFVLATPNGTPDWRLWLIAAVSAAAMLATRLNPLWLLASGGVLGGLLL